MKLSQVLHPFTTQDFCMEDIFREFIRVSQFQHPENKKFNKNVLFKESFSSLEYTSNTKAGKMKHPRIKELFTNTISNIVQASCLIEFLELVVKEYGRNVTEIGMKHANFTLRVFKFVSIFKTNGRRILEETIF